MKYLTRIGGYALLPAIAALAPLIALPAVTAAFGDLGWAAIAIGISTGGAASVLVELGWGLNGPVRVSRAGLGAQRSIYALSLLTKLVTLTPAAIAAAILAWLVSPDYRFESALAAIATASIGMSSMWFFVGKGKPMVILITDTLPKVLLSTVSAVAIARGGSLTLYPLALLVAALLSPAIGAIFAKVRVSDFRRFKARHVVKAIGHQSVALRGRAASTIYISLPVVIIGIVAPNSVAVFSAAERLQRMFLALLQSVPNALLPWVASPANRNQRRRRAVRSIWLNIWIGVAAGTVFALAAPIASELLFSGVATVPTNVAMLCGVLIAITCASRATGGIALVSFFKISTVSNSAILGAIIGLPSVAVLGLLFGTLGGIMGMVFAELSVLAFQALVIRRVFHALPAMQTQSLN